MAWVSYDGSGWNYDYVSINNSGTLTFSLFDYDGVKKAEVIKDGVTVLSDTSGAMDYYYYWDITSVYEGYHSITINAYDIFDNKTELTYYVYTYTGNIPATPVITSPVDGAVLTSPNIIVSGTAQAGMLVTLFINNWFFWDLPPRPDPGGGFLVLPTPVEADSGGNFSFPITLYEFTNIIYAVATDPFGGSRSVSPYVTVTLDPLLANPTGLTLTAEPDPLQLNWEPVIGVHHYNLYQSHEYIYSVEAMTPIQEVAGISAVVTGLAEETRYYFAVTSVDSAGGERKTVEPVYYLRDVRGPAITNVQVGGSVLIDNLLLTAPTTVTLSASDFSGVNRIEFYIDNLLLATDVSGPPYSWLWNIADVADGPHTLTVKGYDTLGNLSSKDYTLNIALAPPPAPALSQPANGAVVAVPEITVSGTAATFSEVELFKGGLSTGITKQLAANGSFSWPFALAEGENKLTVKAKNRAGYGPPSAEVKATFLLANPTGLAVTAEPDRLLLSWNPVGPAAHLGHYNLYVSGANFSSVSGMTPALTATTTSAELTDLQEDTKYYLAVTSVNQTGGERPQVNTVSGNLKDVRGPVITNQKVGANALTDNLILTAPVTFTLNAADFSGVNRVDFLLNGAPLCSDAVGPLYDCFLNVVNLADGPYTLTINAHDQLTNLSSLSYPMTVALSPPAAPVLNQPGNNSVFATPEITVSGTAPTFNEVELFNHGQGTGTTVPVATNGSFSLPFTLAEGENVLTAKAKNRAGYGPASGERKISFLLANPTGLAVTAEPDRLLLSWNPVGPAAHLGHYNLYVSGANFSSVAGMTPTLTVTTTSAELTDLQADTKYYLAVTSVNQTGGERPQVNTVSGNLKDVRGPAISNQQVGGSILADNLILTAPAAITLNAADFSGVSRVDFLLNGAALCSDAVGPLYDCFLNVVNLADGSYSLTINAYDQLTNLSSLDYTIAVALATPAAPVLNQPANNSVFATPEITVSGTAPAFSEVELFNHGQGTGTTVQVATNGSFSLPFTLAEGENVLTAKAKNRAGYGPPSDERKVSFLLANPTGLAVTAEADRLLLSWNPVEPAAHLGHYNVYVKGTDFSSVTGMTPVVTATSTSAEVTGLQTDSKYYLAVTSVEMTGGERPQIKTVSASLKDINGPLLGALQYGGQVVPAGATLTQAGSFSLSASDFSGVSRVEFYIDSLLLATDASGPGYAWPWNIAELADGQHILTVKGYDSLGNTTLVDCPLNIALAPPPAPVLAKPTTGATNIRQTTVSGTASLYTEAVLFNNGVETSAKGAVDATGKFSFSYELAEGDNLLKVAARYPGRSGFGVASNAVTVTLDTTIPLPPSNLAAQAKEVGKARLSWLAPSGTTVLGYNLYRQPYAFSTKSGKVNAALLTTTSYTDLPATEGEYFYRVEVVSTANNASDLSPLVSVLTDATPPSALWIDYLTDGKSDPLSGRMAPGTVALALKVSEPLLSMPFLSITPHGGVPAFIELSQQSPTEYRGSYTITTSTPAGTAYAVFSARDMVGNRGVEIDSGASLVIDASGPAVGWLIVEPTGMIKNAAAQPVTVSAIIGLNEPLKSGTTPQLGYLLSGLGRQAATITDLAEIAPPLPGHAQSWRATFQLPDDGGLAEPESFHFIYSGTDDLDNPGSLILADNLFQVYQGELPPLAPPSNLQAKALPAGQVGLSWEAVAEAVGYQLYRQAPGETELSVLVASVADLSYLDSTFVDGPHTYAVASIRQENGQESISGLSTTVTVRSDSAPPEGPTDLYLYLDGKGVQLSWDAPVYNEPVTFRIYREDQSEITAVEGLTPYASAGTKTAVTDAKPSLTDHCYVVTAIDQVGNESPLSNSFYLNFKLLPVDSLTITRLESDAPVVSWTHSGATIAGYRLLLGEAGAELPLHNGLLTAKSYVDTGYTGGARRYTVIAVDNFGEESAGRSLDLPYLTATLQADSTLKRGLMNRLEYLVENHSGVALEHLRLRVRVGGIDHLSEEFALEAGGGLPVAVRVGGYSTLVDPETVTAIVEVTPNVGELVRLVHSDLVPVGEGVLNLTILNEEFTRGVDGKVWFSLENTGAEEIEIVTASGSGKSSSPEISLTLQDKDGNVLVTAPFKQTIGTEFSTLSNGLTVVRVPAGATFVSDPVTLKVPLSAPNAVVVRLSIAKVRYHTGRIDAVVMQGVAAALPLTLIDTSYSGEILNITPQQSRGDQDIIINGRAVERSSATPMPNAPLEVVVTVSGFDRTYNVVTDAAGQFSATFTPLCGESGVYTVRAVHPDLLDRPVQGGFVITRTLYSPDSFNITVPRNYEQSATIKFTTGAGTTVDNLHLQYDTLPPGLTVTLPASIATVAANKTVSLTFKLSADNSVKDISSFELRLVSGQGAVEEHGLVIVNLSLVEAKPVLAISPTYIQTGVLLGSQNNESLVLSNRGVADMNDVTLSLIADPVTGSLAPNWISLASSANLGTIPVGGSATVSVGFTPTAAQVGQGNYSYYLRVESSNHRTVDIGLYVAVTTNEVGDVIFNVADIYTGTLGVNGNPIPGLAGARILMQREVAPVVEQSRTTDANGEVFFADLPSGSYKYRITAPNHQEKIGRLWVKPGMTATEAVFLDYNLVTVEWSVTETTIQDKYDIVLNATYATDVPAAVVIAEPASVTLPEMRAGDVFNGEIKLTNHGLINAEEIKFALPPDNEFFHYELLAGLPSVIGAKQSVVVPYKVTCLKSPTLDTSGEATGGGGCGKSYIFIISFSYRCPNGQKANSSLSFVFIFTFNSCGASISVEWFWIPQDRGASSQEISATGKPGPGIHSPSPSPTPLGGDECVPSPSPPGPGGDGGGPGPGGGDGPGPGGGGGPGPGGGGGPGPGGGGGPGPSGGDGPGPGGGNPGGGDGPGGDGPGGDGPGGDGPGGDGPGGDGPGNDGPGGGGPDGCGSPGGGSSVSTGSSVDLFMGEYNDDVTDLSVKVQGHWVVAKRWYYGQQWHFNYLSWNMRIERWENGAIKNITKDRITYTPLDSANTVFGFKSDWRITASAAGFRFQHKNGQWSEHDANGKILRYGNSNNVAINFVYDEVATERLMEVRDHSDHPVLWFTYRSDGTLATAGDAAGRTVQYYYNAAGLLSRVVDVKGNESLYSYDSKGRLVKKQEPAGFIRNVTYDPNNRVQSVTDENGSGKRFEYAYDSNQKRYRASVFYPGGGVKESGYNERGELLFTKLNGTTLRTVTHNDSLRMKTVTDKYDLATNWYYDERMNPVKVLRNDGAAESYEYEPERFRLTRAVNELGVATSYRYDGLGNLTRVVEAEGTPDERVSEYTYDASGNLLTATRLADAKTPEATTSYTYDTEGNRLSITDPEGGVARYTYNQRGQVLTSEDGNANVWTYTYDPAGYLTSVVDMLGNLTSYEYDGQGHLTKVVNAEAKATSFGYDSSGRLLRITDALGNFSTRSYDPDGNLRAVTDAEGKSLGYRYDPDGRLLSATDGAGNTVLYEYGDDQSTGCGLCTAGWDKPVRIIYPTFTREFTYDKRYRLTETRDLLSAGETHVTQYSYDQGGRLTSVTDPEGRKTAFVYDKLDRLVSSTDPAGGSTGFDYDDRNNLLHLTDAKGQRTGFTYDLEGKKLSEIRPDGQLTSYAYDPGDRLVAKVDAKGQKLGLAFDAANRLTALRYYPVGDHNNPAKIVSFGHSVVGRLTDYDDGVSSGSYSYDALGRKTGESVDYGPFTLTSSYDYYKNGLKKSYTGPDEAAYTYSYDAANRLAGVEIPGQGLVTFNSYQWNRPTKIILPGGATKAYSYDGLLRLTGIAMQDPAGAVLMDYAYSHDRSGNITANRTEHGDYAYSYDVLSRLTSATGPVAPAKAYSYDAVGNRLTADGVINEFVYNGNNELTSAADLGLAYSYDANGNTVARLHDGAVVQGYGYDADNRLTSVRDGAEAVIAGYGYDPSGRRLWKEVSGVKTWFFYNDEGLVGEYGADGTEQKSYGWLPGSTWSTDPLFMAEGGQFYWYLNDHLGTPRKLINSNGLVVWSASYDSFGKAEVDAGSVVVNNLRFPGQYWDEETGLHYNWHRYYDPETGRYVTADPIGLAGGVNLYSYVQNNPVNFVDPMGLDTWQINRKLGGDRARSKYNDLSHTFVAKTDQNNRVTDTYSWGNTANPHGWHHNAPEDLRAAQEAINKDMGIWIGDQSYDPFVDQAFQDLKGYQHRWWPWNNCKHESGNLECKARDKQNGTSKCQ